MKTPARFRPITLIVLSGFAFFVFAFALRAQVVNISAVVPSPEPPETIITFEGIAYPNAPVVIEQDGLAFTNTTANAAARFSVSQNGISAGAHTYSLVATDALGRDSRELNVGLTITAGTTTIVDNIFFGPTIVLDSTDIELGESITVSGITSPSSEVSIYLTLTTQTIYTVTASSTGAWSRTFSSELEVGSYTIRGRATDPDTSVSEYSDTLTFTVGEPPDVCSGANVADINCDGEVDLTDLSILLFYWEQLNPGNARADINHDTIVDLVDFSILMYHWTGPT